jgi:hypothetical protein
MKHGVLAALRAARTILLKSPPAWHGCRILAPVPWGAGASVHRLLRAAYAPR